MSVIKSKRGVSGVQFLDTARDLHIFTMRTCVKFPKRYTFFITNKIVETASNIHTCVKRGNSIFPSNANDVRLRREEFLTASVEIQSLISQINVAYEIFPIADKTMLRWLDLINKEMSLVKNVLKKRRRKI